ncbi:MAG: CvpA family protein [Planctomycetota bacterium]|nr:CvpA family protein [Planctomycetota bacterium]
MTTSPYDQPRGIPLWMPIVGLFTAAISYFWMQEDHVAAAVLAAVMVAGFSGFRMGAAKLTGFLSGAVAAIAYAPSWGKLCEPKIVEFLGTTGLTSRIVSIGAIGIGITCAAMIVMAIVARVLLDDRPRLEAMNRRFGFLLGAVQGTGIVLLLLGGLLTVEPMAKERVASRTVDSTFALAVSERIVKVAEQTRGSQFGPLVVAYNPFQYLPQLAPMQESIKLARDPQKLNQLMESPQIEHLKQRPAMRHAIDSLTADAEIQQVLRSGKPIDYRAARSLMSNPTIMKLLDEPGFVSEITKIMSELDVAPQLINDDGQ